MEPQPRKWKMSKHKQGRNLLVLTGAAALCAVAVNVTVAAVQSYWSRKKNLPKSNVRVNLSASEILKLAARIIAKSKEVYDAVASVPLDKVTYMNAISPLINLEAQQFPLVQSCIFPKLVSASNDVRKASAEAQQRLEAHVAECSKREDVYRVISSYSGRGEWMDSEVKYYVQRLENYA